MLKNRVIVTGASGNLGSHIITTNSDLECLRFNRDEVNEQKPCSMPIHAIIHCAYDLKNDINTSPDRVLDSNILSLGKMLEYSKSNSIKNFVFISSCSVYGESSNSSEDRPCYPITMNGFTKLFGEELVKSFCLANNINYLILRIFNSYGGDDHFSVVSKIIEKAKNKQLFTLANEGEAERDFIHIEDAARIIGILAQKSLQNQIINIGSGNPVKIIDIIKATEEKWGNMSIKHIQNEKETIYSRANVQKLKSMINYKLQNNVFEFIRSL